MTAAGEDWTKFVTLNPPNEVKFKFEDKDAKTEESQMDFDAKKAVARIEIINKSKSTILFKVSTRSHGKATTRVLSRDYLNFYFIGENYKYQKLHGQTQCWNHPKWPLDHRQNCYPESNFNCKSYFIYINPFSE